MPRFVLFLFFSLVFQSQQLKAKPWDLRNQFHFRKIKRIEAAYFGNNRLFFDLACNEAFLSVLTEKENLGNLRIGILTETHPSNCSKPPRETFVRSKTGNSTLQPVASFKEVWRCEGICYIISDPEVSPYHPVKLFGTSEKQTREKIPCYPNEQIDMNCEIIEVF